MGLETKPTSFRLDDETLRKIDALQESFAPFTTKRSHVIRFAVEFVHTMVFTKGTLQAVVGRLQSLLCTTSCYEDLPALAGTLEERRPQQQRGNGTLRPRIFPVSRRTLVEPGMAAWVPPSLPAFAIGRSVA